MIISKLLGGRPSPKLVKHTLSIYIVGWLKLKTRSTQFYTKLWIKCICLNQCFQWWFEMTSMEFLKKKILSINQSNRILKIWFTPKLSQPNYVTAIPSGGGADLWPPRCHYWANRIRSILTNCLGKPLLYCAISPQNSPNQIKSNKIMQSTINK